MSTLTAYVYKIGSRFLWLLILCSFGFAAKTQDIPRSNILVQDTASINKLLKSAYKLRESNADSAGGLYTRALEIAKASQYKNGTAEALIGVARYYNIKNQQAKAISYLKNAFVYVE
ncbi:MAG: hypothetical protein EOP53_24140, partial [Sphingobacteriales bacterium]